jgi:hypothetical protein
LSNISKYLIAGLRGYECLNIEMRDLNVVDVILRGRGRQKDVVDINGNRN